MKRLDPYIGEFDALVREMISRGRATPVDAEEKARTFVKECGCEVITLDRLDGRGPVEMIAPPPY